MKSHTLLEVSKLTGISTNAIRYHMRKLTFQFAHLKRDRFNRFRFTTSDIQRIQNIHDLKNHGYDYEEIELRLKNNPLNSSTEILKNHSNLATDDSNELKQVLEKQKLDICKLETRLKSLEEQFELLSQIHINTLIDAE